MAILQTVRSLLGGKPEPVDVPPGFNRHIDPNHERMKEDFTRGIQDHVFRKFLWKVLDGQPRADVYEAAYALRAALRDFEFREEHEIILLSTVRIPLVQRDFKMEGLQSLVSEAMRLFEEEPERRNEIALAICYAPSCGAAELIIAHDVSPEFAAAVAG